VFFLNVVTTDPMLCAPMNMYKVKYKNTDKNNRAHATDVYVSCVFFKIMVVACTLRYLRTIWNISDMRVECI